MRIKRTMIVVISFLVAHMVSSQSVFGKWKTIDDKTGRPKAIVNIYEEDGLMHGKIVKILEEGKEDAVCIKCDDERKNMPIVGMKIIDGLKRDQDGEWRGKTLFDPEQGMTFRCRIWLNPKNGDELKVRGYLAFLYRTQTWIRVEG